MDFDKFMLSMSELSQKGRFPGNNVSEKIYSFLYYLVKVICVSNVNASKNTPVFSYYTWFINITQHLKEQSKQMKEMISSNPYCYLPYGIKRKRKEPSKNEVSEIIEDVKESEKDVKGLEEDVKGLEEDVKEPKEEEEVYEIKKNIPMKSEIKKQLINEEVEEVNEVKEEEVKEEVKEEIVQEEEANDEDNNQIRKQSVEDIENFKRMKEEILNKLLDFIDTEENNEPEVLEKREKEEKIEYEIDKESIKIMAEFSNHCDKMLVPIPETKEEAQNYLYVKKGAKQSIDEMLPKIIKYCSQDEQIILDHNKSFRESSKKVVF